MVEIRERERPLADERSWVKRVSWGAIFAGVFVVLGVQLILSMFGLAIGFGAVDPAQETAPFSGIGWGAGIWWIITAILSMFLGGWSAGRLAGIPRRPSAILHGVVVWSLATLLTLWLATSAIGRVTSGAVGIVGETAGLLGTAVTEEQLDELWRLVPEPVLLFDPDDAGRRAAARAAQTPRIVAVTAETTAMKREFRTASCSASTVASSSNHWVEKPASGKAMICDALNAKSGSRMIGA